MWANSSINNKWIVKPIAAFLVVVWPMILQPLSNLELNTSHLSVPGLIKKGKCSNIVLPLSIISLVVAPLFESISEFLSKLNTEYHAIKIDEHIVLPTCLLAKHILNL